MRLMLSILLPVISALMLAGPARSDLLPDEQRLLAGVNIGRMMSTLERLCSDEFQGRRAGSAEHYLAADYIASEFQSAGLAELRSDAMEGYKQPLTMRYSLIKSKNEITATLSYPSGASWKTERFSYSNYNGAGGLDLDTEVVFVGHGIHEPESGYDDYHGIDVKGKIVLWLPGQPTGVKLTKGSTAVRKMVTAYQHGAVACLICRPSGVGDEWGTNIGLAGAIADFPYLAVDEKIGSELLGASDIARRPPKVGAVGSQVKLTVTPVCDPARKTYNVVSMIPGESDEIVMVGAHYDHLGASAGGEIFHGADDNASGVTVMLEIARIIRESGLTPRRTMVFAAWTGEEAGLIGSNYFAANPPFALKRIVSNLEFDMVGQGKPGCFVTTGAASYPDHHLHIDTSAADLGILIKAEKYPGASDYLAFTRKGVPSSLIYADGEHPNYHTVRDTPAGIDRRVLESAARLGVLSAWRAANR